MPIDPADYGNEPGQGPLRSGGMGMEAPLAEDNLPSTRSKASKRQQHAVEMMRDLCGGNEVVRERRTKYLPQDPGEKPKAYSVRLNRSVFTNFVGRTVDGLTGLVFRKDPELSEEDDDAVPEQIREHWENIDLEGTHGDVFCRDLFADALTAGHAAIFVEYPKTEGRLRRDEEQRLEVRPYWIPIAKENIISWRTTREGGQSVLSQLVLKETTIEPKGDFGEQDVTRYRVLYRENGVVGFRLVRVLDDRSVVVDDEGTYPTQKYIPVSEIRTSGSVGLFDSSPPLLDLAYLNVAHYQQWSDCAYGRYRSNVPFLFGKGIPEAFDENGDLKPVTVGPNTALFTKEADGDVKWVSHDGASLADSQKALDDLKSDIGSLGLSMLAPQKRSAETAEAKRLDKSTSDSALSVGARALQDGIENALQFHANYLRMESGGSVTINRDFEGLLMDAPVMSAYAQLVNAGFPSRPVLQMLQRGGRIPDDADLDELEAEWLMGQTLNREVPEPEMDMAA